MSDETVPRVPIKSWRNLELKGLSIRNAIDPQLNIVPQAIDLAELFEGKLKKLLNYDYAIKDLPPYVEAITSCKSRQIILSAETYERLGDPTHPGYGRARFTVAHELCHISEHAQFLTESTSLKPDHTGIRLNRASLKPFEDPEAQANAFATRFLMPTAQVKLLLQQGATVYDIARIFGVSFQAANYRIAGLK